MVETRRGSSSSKRQIDPPSSPPHNGKRPKGSEDTSSTNDKPESAQAPVSEPIIESADPEKTSDVPVNDETVAPIVNQGNSAGEEPIVKLNVSRSKKREGKAKADVACVRMVY